MVVFPNVKINLGLNVLEKRADGYHNLQSIFYPVNWCDILEIVPSNDFHFEATGIQVTQNPEENLVVRAYRQLEKKYDLGPVKICLHKVVPSGAGLGAGSSDAAFALKTLNELFKLGLSEQSLAAEALVLGSDCPFFIYNSPCLVTGRGEILEKIPLRLTGYWIKLVHTGLHISTKEAFEGIHPKPTIINLKDIESKNIHDFGKLLINDFETGILAKHEPLNTVRQNLLSEGAFFTSMSGSGSAFYGLFEKEPKLTKQTKFEFITQLV